MSVFHPLTAAQADLMAAMHRVCFKEVWDAKAMGELLAMPGSFGWLAADLSPQGFILARIAADEAEILTLLVLPPFRRQGIAAALVRMAAEQARRQGATRFFLEVAADNEAALAAYRKLGFSEIGRRPRYYADGTDALLYGSSLLDP